MRLTEPTRTNFKPNLLPTETELELYLSCFNIENINLEENIFKYIPKHDYTIQRYDTIPNFPYLGQDGAKTSIFKGFKEVPTSIELSSVDLPPVNDSTYLDKLEEERTTNNTLHPLELNHPENIIKELQTGHSSKIYHKVFEIKKCKNLSDISYCIKNAVGQYYQYEKTRFISYLEQFNYVQKLNFGQIKEKVEKIRRTFPGKNIFIMGSPQHLAYLNSFGDGDGLGFPGAYLVSPSYRVRDTDVFTDFKTAVFSVEQMKATIKPELHFNVQRANRKWNVAVAMIIKDAVIIPEDPFNSSEDVPIQVKDSRWHNLI